MYYHIHQYYDVTEKDEIQALRNRINDVFKGRIRVSSLVPYKIGPHPKPMFELIVPEEELNAVKDYVSNNNGGRSALIHPVTRNDLEAHTRLARWLGSPLDLDLSIF